MDIYGAKFQEYCFNISRDIVYPVFLPLFSCSIVTSLLINFHNRKTSISLKRKKIFHKEKTPFFCILEGLSNKQKTIFGVIYTLMPNISVRLLVPISFDITKTIIPFALVGYEVIITNSRYALVRYFITSYPTRAHGIIVIKRLSR